MTSAICLSECQEHVFNRTTAEELILSPQTQYHRLFSHTTHSYLHVFNDDAPGSPQPETLHVTVFDPSKNIHTKLTLKSTDTTDMLTREYLQKRPELGKTVHLAYNGRSVPAQKCLGDLGVKPGAMFITYQKCTGG